MNRRSFVSSLVALIAARFLPARPAPASIRVPQRFVVREPSLFNPSADIARQYREGVSIPFDWNQSPSFSPAIDRPPVWCDRCQVWHSGRGVDVPAIVRTASQNLADEIDRRAAASIYGTMK